MSKNKYRKITINNKGVEEQWLWLYGKSNISIRNPDNKGFLMEKNTVQEDYSNQYSVTPRDIADYIYRNILRIPNPNMNIKKTEVIQNKEPVKSVVQDIANGFVYLVILITTEFNEDCNIHIEKENIIRIFNNPARAKEYTNDKNKENINNAKVKRQYVTRMQPVY